LAGCGLITAAESAETTGEPHALPGPPDPMDQQAITWCAALEWRPSEDHTLERPAAYEFWRSCRADFWPGPQLGWTTPEPETGLPLSRPLFAQHGEQDLWTFVGFGMADITPTRSAMSLFSIGLRSTTGSRH
jgi:hypothetical protein